MTRACRHAIVRAYMASSSENTANWDTILEAFDRAPVGEPFTPEQRAELDQMTADIAAGRIKLVPHAEVHTWVVTNSPEESEFAAE